MTTPLLQRPATAAATLLAACLQAMPVGAQVVAPQPVIDEHPLPATVLSGEGAAFAVQTRAVGGGFITRIEWHDGQGRLLQTGTGTVLRRNAWFAADAGSYTATVHHSNGSRVTSRPALLTVLDRGWAPVGGRALSNQASTRVPALELCDRPTLAWVENTAAGTRELRVNQFDGALWKLMGQAPVQGGPAHSPNEPSLQCSRSSGRPVPVLAFSESWVGGGQITVKRWDGRAWWPVGAVNGNPGAVPRAPVLRMPPPDGSTIGDPPEGSWLAWNEGAGLAAARWQGPLGWLGVGGGQLPGSTFGPPVLAIDSVTRTMDGPTLAPLLAAISVNAEGSVPVVMQYGPPLDWTWLGGGLAAPVRNGLQVVGLGFTNENSAPRAVLVWTEGSTKFTLRSSTLFDTDYSAAAQPPYPRPAWRRYVADLTGTDLRAMAFDPQPFDVTCRGSGPDSFTLALSARGVVDVLMSRCVNGPAAWVPVVPRLTVDARMVALKMIDHDNPLVATVAPTGFGSYAITVWKYRP